MTKIKYDFLRRIYVRAEYPDIDVSYENYLLKKYEYSYFPKTILKAGKAIYIKRNYEMINNSDYCIIYYKKNDKSKKSGTEIAYKYSIKKNVTILI